LKTAAGRLLVLCFSLALAPCAGANQRQQTICCRSSGGTRGTCLNLWAHLVPISNRFDPGPSRLIALLQGPSPNTESMRVQVFSATGQPLTDQTLPAQRVAIWLLTLPQPDRQQLTQPLLWESFPTCRPNRPPTRTLLETGRTPPATTRPSPLADLLNACEKEVATGPLLRAFGLEEWINKLPETLPVRCQALKASSGALLPSPENGASP
jgi:hypothetical protein